jgi:rRNA-processing protein FCF1
VCLSLSNSLSSSLSLSGTLSLELSLSLLNSLSLSLELSLSLSLSLLNSLSLSLSFSVDGEFLQSALEGKINIREQIPKLLCANATPYVTKCIREDLAARGKFYSGATKIAHGLDHLRCNHAGLVSAKECVDLMLGMCEPYVHVYVPSLSQVNSYHCLCLLYVCVYVCMQCVLTMTENGNPDRLIVGAQFVPLRNKVRDTAGIPVLYIRGNVPLLEPPSKADRDYNAKKVDKAMTLRDDEKSAIQHKKNNKKKRTQQKNTGATGSSTSATATARPGGDIGGASRVSRKRKPIKQANPLSMKKKKKKKKPDAQPSTTGAQAPPRKRSKVDTTDKSDASAPASSSSSSATAPAAAQPTKKRRGKRGRGKKKTVTTDGPSPSVSV